MEVLIGIQKNYKMRYFRLISNIWLLTITVECRKWENANIRIFNGLDFGTFGNGTICPKTELIRFGLKS